MFKTILYILLLSFANSVSQAKSLIQNGDFEGPSADTSNCYEFIKKAKWYVTSKYTCPLLFSTNCFDKTRVAQKSVFGNQKPHNGKSYIGLHPNDHLHTALIKTLEAGNNYCFTMHVSMAEKNAAKGEIGVYFAKTIEMGVEKEVTPIAYYKPSFDVMLQATDTADWISVCGTYKAKGGEKYIVIGNFKSVYKNKKETLIFVDDISVVPQVDNNNECCLEEFHAESGDTVTLKQLLFKTSSVVIETSSFYELDRFADYLKKKQNLKIQINGHTDNVGTSVNNIQLSKNRAKAVYTYLLNKGINSERMKYVGHGSAMPICANDSEEHKAKNRRVEVVFTQ